MCPLGFLYFVATFFSDFFPQFASCVFVFFFFSFAPNIQHFRSGTSVGPHTPPAFVFVHSGCSLWLYFFCQLLFCFCFFCRASSSVGVFLIKTTMQCQSHTSVRHLTRFAPPRPFNHHPTTHKPSCMRAHILFPTHPVREWLVAVFAGVVVAVAVASVLHVAVMLYFCAYNFIWPAFPGTNWPATPFGQSALCFGLCLCVLCEKW